MRSQLPTLYQCKMWVGMTLLIRVVSNANELQTKISMVIVMNGDQVKHTITRPYPSPQSIYCNNHSELPDGILLWWRAVKSIEVHNVGNKVTLLCVWWWWHLGPHTCKLTQKELFFPFYSFSSLAHQLYTDQIVENIKWIIQMNNRRPTGK